MRKLISKIFPIFGIIAALVLIWLGLRFIDRDGTAPSYGFLAGRSPVACRDEKKGNVDKCYIYSFEGDFNDVCSNAGAELISMGFIDRTLPSEKSRKRTFWLKEIFHCNPVNIQIHNNHMYVENDDAIGPKDGWVVVKIIYWRGWWP